MPSLVGFVSVQSRVFFNLCTFHTSSTIRWMLICQHIKRWLTNSIIQLPKLSSLVAISLLNIRKLFWSLFALEKMNKSSRKIFNASAQELYTATTSRKCSFVFSFISYSFLQTSRTLHANPEKTSIDKSSSK